MAANGSPALVFTPDNQTDDYTMATAYINAEFARIRAGELAGLSAETTKETTKETVRSMPDRIVELLAEHPEASAPELALRLGITADGVRYHLRKLRKSGTIEHVGPTKGGSWRVVG